MERFYGWLVHRHLLGKTRGAMAARTVCSPTSPADSVGLLNWKLFQGRDVTPTSGNPVAAGTVGPEGEMPLAVNRRAWLPKPHSHPCSWPAKTASSFAPGSSYVFSLGQNTRFHLLRWTNRNTTQNNIWLMASCKLTYFPLSELSKKAKQILSLPTEILQ